MVFSSIFFTANFKKAHTDQRILEVFYSADSKTFKSISFYEKPFLQCVCYWYNLLWCFVAHCDYRKALFFIKVYFYSEVLFNCRVLAFFWNKEFVRILFVISTILIPKPTYKARTKVLKWSFQVSYLLNFLKVLLFFDAPQISLQMKCFLKTYKTSLDSCFFSNTKSYFYY